MPVVDHGQHTSTAKDSQTHRYGCWNRRDYFDPPILKPYIVAADGWVYATEERHPHRMSHECRYDRSEADPACAGCKHCGSGAAYTRRQEEGGAK